MTTVCDSLPLINWLEPSIFQLQDSIAIYKIQINENIRYVPALNPLLSTAELVRANKYHRLADHNRFVIARAALRILLGKYTQQRPNKIEFELGINKKPRLKNTPGLHYNTSHSDDCILLAIAAVPVGADVEKIDSVFSYADILSHSFSPQEQEFIARSATPARAFFQLWTRKEALVKATGQGIDADFCHVPALDGRHHAAGGVGAEAAEWAVSSFEVAAGYVGAVARPAARPASSLRFFEVGASLLGAFAAG